MIMPQNTNDNNEIEPGELPEEDELLVGDYNDLEVAKLVDFGLYLNSEYGEILLPKGKVPAGAKPGDILHVFVYVDSETRLIATTDTPLLTVDHCGLLEVKDINKFGAFVDLGIDNQLLVPYSEQTEEMVVGKKYMIWMYLDHVSDRLVGSMRLDRYLHNNDIGKDKTFDIKARADLYVFQKTALGFKALVNGRYIGLLYENELEQPIKTGDQLRGYIRKIREDGKIDLSLKQPGFERVAATPERILAALKDQGGFLPLNDKSSPEEIKAALDISKSDFKKAVGILYKQKKIVFKDNGIALAI